MATRDDLKALIDRLPNPAWNMSEPCLSTISILVRRPRRSAVHRRFEDYKMLVERRFRETRKPGTIGGMTGGGSAGMHGHSFRADCLSLLGRQGFGAPDSAIARWPRNRIDGAVLGCSRSDCALLHSRAF